MTVLRFRDDDIALFREALEKTCEVMDRARLAIEALEGGDVPPEPLPELHNNMERVSASALMMSAVLHVRAKGR
jgi:hypothetical protein